MTWTPQPSSLNDIITVLQGLVEKMDCPSDDFEVRKDINLYSQMLTEDVCSESTPTP